MGYINGQVQPEGKYLHTRKITWLRACSSPLAVAFADAPTPIPSLAYPAVPAHLPAESSLTPDVGLPAEVEDLPDPAGTASIPLDSEPATDTPGLPQSHEEPDDSQQLPRQIHIQQHLKLHFHNQGEFCREQSDDAHLAILLFLSFTGLCLSQTSKHRTISPVRIHQIWIQNCPITFTALIQAFQFTLHFLFSNVIWGINWAYKSGCLVRLKLRH